MRFDWDPAKARENVERSTMSQANKASPDKQMRAEYDLRGGVRGKYYERYRQGTNIVVLEPDIAAVFPDSAAVNQALRLLIRVAREQVAEASSSAKSASV